MSSIRGANRARITLLTLLFVTVLSVLDTRYVEAEGLGPLPPPEASVGEILFVSPHEDSVEEILEVTIGGLAQKLSQEKVEPKALFLYLNGRPLQALKAESIDLLAGTIRFHLQRLDGDRDVWTSLLGSPPISGRRYLTVGVGWDLSHQFNKSSSCSYTVAALNIQKAGLVRRVKRNALLGTVMLRS